MNSYNTVQINNPYGDIDDVLEIFIDTADSYRLNDITTEQGQYTFVIWHKALQSCSITFNVFGVSETVTSNTGWSKYVKTVEFDGINNNIDITPDVGSTIYLYQGYIAQGDRDKSWSLAPEDILENLKNNNELISQNTTMAEQTSEKFTWLVKSGTDSTNFELTDRTALLVSKYINLKGLVSFSAFDGDTQGKINKSIFHVDVMYAFGSSNTVAPSTGWSTTAPEWQSGKYMWQKTVITYIGGNKEESSPTCISGANGSDGKGATSIIEQYYLSTSNTSQVGGSWKNTQDTWSEGKYFWTRSEIKWNDGTTTYTDPVLANGLNNANSTANSANNTANTANKNASDALSKAEDAVDVANSVDGVIASWCYDNDKTYINGGKIYTGSISTDQLAANSIVADKIATGAITANKINVSSLSAIAANLGTVTSGTIIGGIITTNADRLSYNSITSGLTMTSGGIGAGDGTNNTFYVTNNGKLYSTSGSIAGWNISSNELSKTVIETDKQTESSLSPTLFNMKTYEIINNGGELEFTTSTELRIEYGQIYGEVSTGLNGGATRTYDFALNPNVLSMSASYGGDMSMTIYREGSINWSDINNMCSISVSGYHYIDYTFDAEGTEYSVMVDAPKEQLVITAPSIKLENNTSITGTLTTSSSISASGSVTANDFWRNGIGYCVASPNTSGVGERVQKLILVNGSTKYLEITANSAWGCNAWSSDKRLKTNILPVTDNSLDIIKRINHVSFDWKDGSGHVSLGYIADELELIMPEAIFEVGEYKYKNIDHSKVIPHITKCTQELIKEIENLKQENNRLNQELKDINSKLNAFISGDYESYTS